MKNKLALLLMTFSLLLVGCNSKTPAKEGVVNLEIYAVNDFHGNVIDSDTGVGISKMTSFFKEKSANKNTLLISQGDMWQGSAESNLTKGNLVTDWMNQNGFVSMTLGNHEFDWGEQPVIDNSLKAEFPFLAINIYSHTTNEPVTYCQPSTIVEKYGTKIGIIGAVGDCYSSISASKVTDIYFKVGDELTALVKKEATRLKEEGCDMIIYSLHEDDENYDLSLSVDYVDLVLEGHTHQSYIKQDSKGVYHLQGGGYNKTIPYINLDLNTKTNKITVNRTNTLSTKGYPGLSKDPDTEALFTKYQDLIADVRNPIGTNSVRRDSNYLRQLVSSLYLEKGLEKWGNEYNIFLGGGYLSCRSPYYLKTGQVSYADIYNLFPFDNDIVLCSISGFYLSERFINTDNDNYFISYSSYGESHKTKVNDQDTYYIIADTYSLDYAPNHLTLIETYQSDGYYARDLLKEYLIAGNFA